MKTGTLLLISLIATAPAVLAQDTASVQKAIQAQYEKRNAAAKKKDVTGALSINTPDFVALDPTGTKRTLTQLRPLLSEAFANTSSYLVATQIKSVNLTGNKAIVNTNDNAKLTSKNNKVQEVTRAYEDIWVKQGNQWLRQQSRTLSGGVKKP